jgi:2-polyprenyl-6-methoxyphenol hydroxylase-like FAD-dependent oxidoreductase
MNAITHDASWDCIIVGAGPAGLNAALVLGRARRRVRVLDNGAPRNYATHEMHGVLGHDGLDPPTCAPAAGRSWRATASRSSAPTSKTPRCSTAASG